MYLCMQVCMCMCDYYVVSGGASCSYLSSVARAMSNLAIQKYDLDITLNLQQLNSRFPTSSYRQSLLLVVVQFFSAIRKHKKGVQLNVKVK
jgi:hypothetical protein